MKKITFDNGDILTAYEFEELTQEQKNKEIESIITMLIETTVFDEDQDPNEDDFVQRACRKAEEMHTPWFCGEYVWEYGEKEILEMPSINGWLYNSEGEMLPITTYMKGNEVLKHTYGKTERIIQIN